MREIGKKLEEKRNFIGALDGRNGALTLDGTNGTIKTLRLKDH